MTPAATTLQDYVETLGVNFLEKTIDTPSAQVTLSLWDLGGDRSYVSMLPMVRAC